MVFRALALATCVRVAFYISHGGVHLPNIVLPMEGWSYASTLYVVSWQGHQPFRKVNVTPWRICNRTDQIIRT